MAELKTKATEASVENFLNEIKDERRRQDCFAVMEILQKATRSKPKMWGDSIVGFGACRCAYASGREIDWFLAGFSPRKQALTLYLMGGFPEHQALMQRLGKCKSGKGCLYIKKLADVDLPTLKELIAESVQRARALMRGKKK
jgi:hypothetical protein